ncbi:superinfection immunity protein [Microlunatus sp. Y2014]|uniref:superinfection immunity protein n=1 Tax=Microlunatus sp. Y2014 TaxID=3418488 RepID=UPI003DA7513E
MSYYPQPQGSMPPRPHENSGTHIAIAWILAVLTGFGLLPWAIAATRHKENTTTIALINVFLGWTGVGWIIALVMACLSDPVRPPHQTVIPGYATPAPHYQQSSPYQQRTPPAITARADEEFPAYRPPPAPFAQAQGNPYAASQGQHNPYAPSTSYGQTDPYGQPSAYGVPYEDPLPERPRSALDLPEDFPARPTPYGDALGRQHAFGMSSTDAFSTYPEVERPVPTVEGIVQARRGDGSDTAPDTTDGLDADGPTTDEPTIELGSRPGRTDRA